MANVKLCTAAMQAFGENPRERMATLLRAAKEIRAQNLADESNWRKVLADRVTRECGFPHEQRNFVLSFIADMSRIRQASIRSECLGGVTPHTERLIAAEATEIGIVEPERQKARRNKTKHLPHENETDEGREQRMKREYIDAVSWLSPSDRSITALARQMTRPVFVVKLYVDQNPWLAELLAPGKRLRQESQ